MTWLIIGFGNPSRMDDGVGHYVVNRLNRRWGLPAIDLLGEPSDDGGDTVELNGHRVRTMWLQQLDYCLAEEVAEVERLILVDCHIGGPEIVAGEVAPARHVGVTTHVVSPETLIELARRLYGRAPAAVRYTARGERFDFAAELQPAVQQRADELVERIVAEIAGA